MPRINGKSIRIATEAQTIANIDWAKARAIEAKSPDGLTTLAKSFWHTMNKRPSKQRRS
tara:strand:- start:469 stop:645 length:177 start_codon:yes stop_codon:yes gene_type:complete